MKKICLIAGISLAAIALIFTVLFGLSSTLDYYACHNCKSVGRGRALRAYRLAVVRGGISLTKSYTGQQCDHEWRWYFANSSGIMFNKEYWDGPLGDYPFAKWAEEKTANQSLQGTGEKAAGP